MEVGGGCLSPLRRVQRLIWPLRGAITVHCEVLKIPVRYEMSLVHLLCTPNTSTAHTVLSTQTHRLRAGVHVCWSARRLRLAAFGD